MNITFCHVYAISDPGNSRYTGVLSLLKGRALHPEDVHTPYVCRTAEARHLERFIVGLLHDLEVGVEVHLHRQRSS